MMETKKPYELTEQDYLKLCDECRKNVIDSKDVDKGCPCYHDCLVECGQRKLLEYIHKNDSMDIILGITLSSLYKEFRVK